jgi:hypothetical protein
MTAIAEIAESNKAPRELAEERGRVRTVRLGS